LLLQEPAEVPGLLCYPVAIRMITDACYLDTPSSDFDEKENVQSSQEQCLNSQKITGQELTLVVIHKVSPAK
jgi:hypothetical protein